MENEPLIHLSSPGLTLERDMRGFVDVASTLKYSICP
jgi:hypothetical protein